MAKTIFIEQAPVLEPLKGGLFRVLVTDANGKQYRLVWTVEAFYAAHAIKAKAIRSFEADEGKVSGFSGKGRK